jgi:1-phosphofructokinase family hexose kinase
MAIWTVGLNPAVDRILSSPELKVGQACRVQLEACLAAGKALNVARALALRGADAWTTGLVGAMERDFFLHQIEAFGPGKITADLCPCSGMTRQNITLLATATQPETHLREAGAMVNPAEYQRWESGFLPRVRLGDWVVIAGSLPPGVHLETIVALLEKLKALGALTVVDAEGALLKTAIHLGVTMIKPNEKELADYLGGPLPYVWEDMISAMRPIHEHGTWVALTLGARGALLAGPQHAWRAQVHLQRPVIRTVGCGDFFLGGLLSRWVREGPGPETLADAIAMGTARAYCRDFATIDEPLWQSLRSSIKTVTLR